MEYNDEMVREAIERECARNGQVYYVYNRVEDIAEVTAHIQKLVPELNVSFAHGQMKEHELEKIMYDFINGDIDVLVSTTIIETGLDISNVNTMIIHDADRLGAFPALSASWPRRAFRAYGLCIFVVPEGQIIERDCREASGGNPGIYRSWIRDSKLPCVILKSVELEIFLVPNSTGIWKRSDTICTAKC